MKTILGLSQEAVKEVNLKNALAQYVYAIKERLELTKKLKGLLKI